MKMKYIHKTAIINNNTNELTVAITKRTLFFLILLINNKDKIITKNITYKAEKTNKFMSPIYNFKVFIH